MKLYEPVHAAFERFCRARVYGQMDYRDLMHESILIAFQRLDSLRDHKAFLSFLIGISVRILANDHRKKKEVTLVDLKDHPEMDSGQSGDLAAEVRILYESLALLPDHQRECLLLFEINGFPIKEIAGIQQTSVAAVKKRLERGRKRLKQILTLEKLPKPENLKTHG